MKINDNFELVDIAEEHIVVPIGDRARDVQGVFVLNEAASFLLEHMRQNQTMDELVNLLIENYNVDREKACYDITKMLFDLQKYGLSSE